MMGIDKVNSHSLFQRAGESKTGGHRFKGGGERFKRELKDNFLTQMVVCLWNELPEEVVEAGTITTCKRHWEGRWIRKVWKDIGQAQASEARCKVKQLD